MLAITLAREGTLMPERCCSEGHMGSHQHGCNNVFRNHSQNHSKGEGTNEPDEVHDIGGPGIDLPNDCHSCKGVQAKAGRSRINKR